MKLPADNTKYNARFRYVEVARYIPSKNRVSRIQDEGTAVLLDVEDLEKFRNKYDNFGLYTSLHQYDSTDLTTASSLGSLCFDLDSSDLETSRLEALRLVEYLSEYIPDDALRVYFSGGKGFHIECHPGDQKILTKDHGYIAIADLDENVHEIVTYEKNKDRIRRPNSSGGGRLDRNPTHFSRSSRLYNGNMLSITAAGKNFKCTPNHHLTVSWSDRAKQAFAVYLMRRGTHWRIGKMKLFSSQKTSRIKLRMHEEDADEIWILGLFDTESEALMYENIWSYKFGIPQICFVPSRYWRNCLTDENALFVFDELQTSNRIDDLFIFFRLDKNLPFRKNDGIHFNGGNSDQLTKRFKIHAINLIPDFMRIPVDNGSRNPTWTDKINVDSYHFEGEVYNLALNQYHHYLVNDVIVHNCEPIALNISASDDLPGIYRFIAGNIAETLNLTSADLVVYDKRRMWRLVNSQHQRTGLFKVECLQLLRDSSSVETILKHAEKPQSFEIPEQVFNPKANRWFREFVAKFEQSLIAKPNNIDLLNRFLEQGIGNIRTFGDGEKVFDKYKLFKNCSAAKYLVEKAYTAHHLDHYERLFLCSILTYTPDAIIFLHEVLGQCSDYNPDITNAHIEDWIRRREYEIGGRPFTCEKARQVGIICTSCNGMEPKLKVSKLSDGRYIETGEYSQPSPVRHVYTIVKGN